MENRNTIVNELKELSPALAGLTPQTPYTVPAGYFEGLADQLLQRVKATGGEEIPAVLQQANKPTYEVPQGYFEGLATAILNRIKNEAEETSASLLSIKNNDTYQVPANYFDSLPDIILQRAKAEEAGSVKEELEILSPLLSGIGKKNPFSTPAGYFGELTENVVAGAKAIDFVNEELENLSPLMNSLKAVNVYEAPAGYFEQLPQQVLSKAKSQQPAKVVSMSFARKVMRYATAAVVAGVIFVGAWMYFGGSKTPPTLVAEKAVKTISDSSLLNYIESQELDLPEATATLADNNEISENDMKDMFSAVSDEELQQYLEKYSNAKEEANTN